MKNWMRTTIILTTIILLFGAGVPGISGDKTDTSIDIETAIQVAEMKLIQLNKNDFSISNLGEVVSNNEKQVLFYQFDLGRIDI